MPNKPRRNRLRARLKLPTKADSPSVPHLNLFSADESREATQALADGTQITHAALTTVFRDREGRTRTEPHPPQPDSSPTLGSPKLIEITDPAADIHYTLNPHDCAAQVRPRLAYHRYRRSRQIPDPCRPNRPERSGRTSVSKRSKVSRRDQEAWGDEEIVRAYRGQYH